MFHGYLVTGTLDNLKSPSLDQYSQDRYKSQTMSYIQSLLLGRIKPAVQSKMGSEEVKKRYHRQVPLKHFRRSPVNFSVAGRNTLAP